MKKFLLIICSTLCAINSQAQFVSQNINLFARWFDSTVVAEPNYGIKYNSIWGWKNTTQNKEYAILGSSGGTFFIDVTNPANPIKCDYVAGRRGNCIWREYKTYQHYAYMVSDDGAPNSFQIMDLSYLPDSVHVVYDSDSLFVRSHTIFIDGSKMYCGYNTTLHTQYSMAVYDLAANPERPVFLRSLNQDSASINVVHDMLVRNDTIYASCGYQGLHVYKYVGGTFSEIGSLITYPAKGYNHSSAITDDGHTMIFCDEVPTGLAVKSVDISDLVNISVNTTFKADTSDSATAHNPYILGNNAIIAYYQAGLQIFDISNPSVVTRTGFYDTNPTNGAGLNNPNYTGCWGAYPFLPSGIILASDMQNGLFILDATEAIGVKNISLETNAFSLYPNPAQEQLNVVFKNHIAEEALLTVYNLSGKLIQQEKINPSSANTVHSINTQKLTAGMYFVKVMYGDKIYFKKFSKV